MWAFAVWDRQRRTLFLSRDRLGKKPLYFGWAGSTMLFGSELKALKAYPGFHGEIDRGALALFLRYGYVPTPYSIFQRVWKLQQGTVITLPIDTVKNGASYDDLRTNIRRYWSPREVAEKGMAEPFAGTDSDAVTSLDKLLRDAVACRMVADVPLGAFLSGGIDSSTVVALMQAQHHRPIKTFSIGFHESAYNEAHYARAIADHLQTEHTELYVTPKEAMAIIPKLPTLYDEPFADSSQIPTFLVSQLARRDVTVSLSGDGGDELFGGYTRYVWGKQIWRGVGTIPVGWRQCIAGGMRAFAPRQWDAIFGLLGLLLPTQYRRYITGDKLHKLARVIAVGTPEVLYQTLVSLWDDPVSLVGCSEWPTVLPDHRQWPHLQELTQRMMFFDLITYLPDDVLAKVDRASMGVGLEVRAPLLDTTVVEFAGRIPLSMKVRHGKGKWLLRQVLKQYMPICLFDRPKTGFGIPIEDWLRGPLRDWAEELLDEKRLREDGVFSPAPIREKWEEHLSGRRNWQYPLWAILMFQAWDMANT
jgi:asparagine synthase (glutamine-hydrolysing)